MTRKQLAALFSEHLQRKHWQYLEREAKAATLENAMNYAMDAALKDAKSLVFKPVTTQRPVFTAVVKHKKVVGYKVWWM